MGFIGKMLRMDHSNRIVFSESKSFYKKLDSSVENGKTIIYFGSEKLNKNSKLWPRLKKCKNWSLLENELGKIQSGKGSSLTNVMSKSMRASLTGGELILISWIALLIAGIFFYGIYKGRKIKIKVNKDGSGEIIVE